MVPFVVIVENLARESVSKVRRNLYRASGCFVSSSDLSVFFTCARMFWYIFVGKTHLHASTLVASRVVRGESFFSFQVCDHVVRQQP